MNQGQANQQYHERINQENYDKRSYDEEIIQRKSNLNTVASGLIGCILGLALGKQLGKEGENNPNTEEINVNDVKATNDEYRCVICLDNEKSCLLLPCKHVCLCTSCAVEKQKQMKEEDSACPICRVKTTEIIRVYL